MKGKHLIIIASIMVGGCSFSKVNVPTDYVDQIQEIEEDLQSLSQDIENDPVVFEEVEYELDVMGDLSAKTEDILADVKKDVTNLEDDLSSISETIESLNDPDVISDFEDSLDILP